MALMAYFKKEYVGIDPIVTSMDLTIIFVAVVLLGVIITTIATAFAVNRYVKMRSDQLYYI
jgi:cell division transport system permease protein